jgi:hypothetical protein
LTEKLADPVSPQLLDMVTLQDWVPEAAGVKVA